MKRRSALLVLIALYVVTWMFGTPSIANHYANETMKFYIANSRADEDYHQTYQPKIHFTVSFPVLPFVLLSKHTHQFGNVGGAGGWLLTVWYITDIYEMHIEPVA